MSERITDAEARLVVERLNKMLQEEKRDDIDKAIAEYVPADLVIIIREADNQETIALFTYLQSKMTG